MIYQFDCLKFIFPCNGYCHLLASLHVLNGDDDDDNNGGGGADWLDIVWNSNFQFSSGNYKSKNVFCVFSTLSFITVVVVAASSL